ncbi:MAG: orotidine-5'-phosphate decarboxylase [Candidatus Omnitrophota bacterium]
MKPKKCCCQNVVRKTELIVALDVPTLKEAKRLVDRLVSCVKIFKVGSQLFTAAGPEIIRYIHKKRGRVFLDLKFHDIPNTVREAVLSAARLKVFMLTVHAQGGFEMLKAAASAVCDLKARPLIVAVTVLTSQADKNAKSKVLFLARTALAAGADGVVSSAQECAALRKMLGRKCVIVTPGIRPQGADAGDQKRVATPEMALCAGSSYIVVGRPIVQAKSPAQAAKGILNELVLNK